MKSFKELMSLYERRANHPGGILEFSLQMKRSLIGTDMGEDKKKEIRSLMSKGILNEREYSRLLTLREVRRSRRRPYHPAADYSRCYLSKAISNIMGRLTSRYKNEAARREFFKKLAAVSEAVHLSLSYERGEALFENRHSDKIADIVLREMATLVKSVFEPSEELRQKSATGRQELSKFMSRVEDLTGVEWEESEKYSENLTLVSFFDPWYVEDEKTERWGVVHYSNPTTLNIAPPVMFFDALRRSVIAREAVNLLAPRIVDSVPRLYEQSEYLVTKLLEDKYEREFWLFARHGLREETKKDVITGISDFFSYYESFVGDDLYKQIWSRLSEMSRLSLPIGSVPEYARILDTIAARPTRVRLEEREVELFRILTMKPDMPLSQLARAIGTSIPTTTKIMQRLTEKACLRFSFLANDRALGLEEILFLVKTDHPRGLPSALWLIPYCRDIYRLYGPMDYFVVMNVPKEKKGFVDMFKLTLRKHGLVSEIVTLISKKDFSNVSLEYYDSKESVWHVHWDSWGAGLAKALKERQTPHQAPGFDERIERANIDKLDLQIMEQLGYDCRRSYSEIGKALGVSGAYVSRKIHRLMKNHVFKPIAKPFKIGAEEYAVVAVLCDDGFVQPIVRWLDKLPAWRGAIVKGDFDGLLAQIGVPSGELNQLFMVLDDRLVKPGTAVCLFNVVGMWSSLRRWLPISLYSKEQGWRFDQDKYLDILSRCAG